MVLSIKSERVDRMVRELAGLTGETITEAVEAAVATRLERERRARRPVGLGDIVDRFASLDVHDARHPDAILGFDDAGLPT
ncbi:hypothetical protein BH23ACT9_BH23ACT9_34870 [soil metagenome]